MKTESEKITTQNEATGQQIVELLRLKQTRDDNGKRFNPPRYETDWGIKTALGIFESVKRIINGEG